MLTSVFRLLVNNLFYESFNIIFIGKMSAFRALVNNPFYESFNIIFMGNEKNCQNINFFSFPIKTFFNWILNQYPKGTH